MKWEKPVEEIISILLVVLFVYTAASKLADFGSFQNQMNAQPLPEWLASLVVWTLPAVEISTGVLLIFSGTRLAGLYVSSALLLMFTGYVGLALAGAFGSIPCSCGGIIESLSWEAHLTVNLIFTVLSLAGIMLYRNHKNLLPAKH